MTNLSRIAAVTLAALIVSTAIVGTSIAGSSLFELPDIIKAPNPPHPQGPKPPHPTGPKPPHPTTITDLDDALGNYGPAVPVGPGPNPGGKGGPNGGSSSSNDGSSSSNDAAVFAVPQLDCAVPGAEFTTSDDLLIANIGSVDLEAGLKLKFRVRSSGDHGAFILPRTIRPGKQLVIPGLLDGAVVGAPCDAQIL